MSEKYKFSDPEGIYFITPTIVGWVDIFTKTQYCEIILDSLKFYQNKKGLIIHAWCIMSSHLHLIISREGKNTLSDIIRDFKKYTAVKIIEEIKTGNDSRKDWMLKLFGERANQLKRIRNYKIWQDGNHPILLSTNEMIDQRLDYLHNNPVKQGLVNNPEDYALSSAIDYAGGKGLIEVEILE
jgi:putative transposase